MLKINHNFKYLIPIMLSLACSGAEGAAQPTSQLDDGSSNQDLTGDENPASETPVADGPPGCSLEYDEMKEEKFALDAETPLGVAAEVIAPWTLEGTAELSRFEPSTSSHVAEGMVSLKLEPIEALYASGTAAFDNCSLYEVLSISTHVVLEVGGSTYEGDGRVEIRPDGVLSGSDEKTMGGGELPLFELSCTAGCSEDEPLHFGAYTQNNGTTMGLITRGSDDLSFKIE